MLSQFHCPNICCCCFDDLFPFRRHFCCVYWLLKISLTIIRWTNWSNRNHLHKLSLYLLIWPFFLSFLLSFFHCCIFLSFIYIWRIHFTIWSNINWNEWWPTKSIQSIHYRIDRQKKYNQFLLTLFFSTLCPTETVYLFWMYMWLCVKYNLFRSIFIYVPLIYYVFVVVVVVDVGLFFNLITNFSFFTKHTHHLSSSIKIKLTSTSYFSYLFNV